MVAAYGIHKLTHLVKSTSTLSSSCESGKSTTAFLQRAPPSCDDPLESALISAVSGGRSSPGEHGLLTDPSLCSSGESLLSCTLSFELGEGWLTSVDSAMVMRSGEKITIGFEEIQTPSETVLSSLELQILAITSSTHKRLELSSQLYSCSYFTHYSAMNNALLRIFIVLMIFMIS